MSAQMRIDQVGLPLGTAGVARTDGLDTGALVTLTNVGGGSTTKFRLLWVPPEDLTAIPTLAAAGPTSWTFAPQAGCWGSYRIELIVDEGLPTESRQVRIFGVRLPSSGLLIPAANEAADPSASRLNAGANVIARSENNEPFAPFGAGSAFGWWKALRDLTLQADAAGGGGITADNLIWVQEAANGGNDATGSRGDSGKPFATIAAALGVVQNGDVVMVGAGSFVGPGFVANVIPAGVVELSIIGAGKSETLIVSGGGPTIAFAYSPVPPFDVEWERFVLANCTLQSDVGNYGLSVQGNNAPLYFPDPAGNNRSGLYVYDVDLTTPGISPVPISIVASNIGFARVERVSARQLGDTLSIEMSNVAQAIVRDVSVGSIFDGIDFGAPPSPSIGCIGSLYERCTAQTVSVYGQSRSIWIDPFVELSFGSAAAGLSVAAGQVPTIRVSGGYVANLDFSSVALPDTPANVLLAFLGTAFGSVSATVAAPAANRQLLRCYGTTIQATIFAGDAVDVDAKSAVFAQEVATSCSTPGSGAIRPPSVGIPLTPNLGPGPTVIALPFTLYDPGSGYAASIEADNVAAPPLAIGPKTTTAITVTSAGAGGNFSGLISPL